MIWSYFCYEGIGPLIFIEGCVQLYIQILKNYVLPHVLDRLDETGMFQTY